MKPRLIPVLAVLAGLAVASAAEAGVSDHLKCFRIRDSLTDRRTIYLADLIPGSPFSNRDDCRVTLPARHFCINVSKANVQAGGEPFDTDDDIFAEDARDYLCYKVKCDRDRPELNLRDQFGIRQVRIRRHDFLCMPANKTEVPTPTPTMTPHPTVTATPNPCRLQDAIDDTGGSPRPVGGVCGGDCPTGQVCLFGFNQTSRNGDGCECVDESMRCELAGNTGDTGDQGRGPGVCSGGLCPSPEQTCSSGLGEAPTGLNGCECLSQVP